MSKPDPFRPFALAALCAALTACAVGPDYAPPELSAPPAFARGAETASAAGERAAAADPAFWRRFDDPQLTRLVETALSANHDLRIALARYDQANALLRGARFDYFPTVTAVAVAADGKLSADQANGGDLDAESYDASLVARWELDVFGRVRRQVESQRASVAASAGDFAALQVSIAGEVARTYLELRGAQERLNVARDNARNQRETLRLVEVRVAAGRGTDFDTARARAQLESTRSRVPALEAEVAVGMHRLAVLTGQSPAALIAELEPVRALPSLPARLDPGTPGELLRRRPDIAAAEQRLRAATARIGVATADLFPRFTLGGLIGTQAMDAGALFEGSSETRLITLGVDWSFLDVGRVRARIAGADAAAAADLARYRQTVLLALEETENALVRYGRSRVEDRHLERAAADSTLAAELARASFEAGSADLFEVLDAERNRLQAQEAFAAGRTRSATAAVALYKALAGGWPQRLPARDEVAVGMHRLTGQSPAALIAKR